VSPADDNPYNNRTRELLDGFRALEIPVGNGNVIFPEGNALRYLSAYFRDSIPENPYVEDPRDVRTLSFSANGYVLDGNVYRTEIGEILMRYRP
jgi:hypothetical protein